MSSSWLLRHASLRTCAAPCRSLNASSPALKYLSASRSFVSSSSRCSLLLYRPLALPFGSSYANGNNISVLAIQSRRLYSSGRKPWQSGSDWKSKWKTGGLVLLGTSALIASTSLAFGFIIAGAAGFGIYTLYQRFLGPYRSHFRSSDPLNNMRSNVDTLNDLFSRNRRRSKSKVQDDLNSLMQGMPLVVRGFVKTMFSFVGKAMQSSMKRVGELRRQTNEHLQANKRVRDQMGDEVSADGPEQWIESTVNGVGRIEAVFPINGMYGSAQVTLKASVGQGGDLNITKLKYCNCHTGETIDLLRDSSAGGRRKTIIDAEYVDLDDEDSRSRR